MQTYLDLVGKIDFEALEKIKFQRDQAWSKGKGLSYEKILSHFNPPAFDLSFKNGSVSLTHQECDDFHLRTMIQQLGPWKKGPFKINDELINSEWRSDLKWKRVLSANVELKDKVILDIGANNGYYMFRMLEEKAKFVLGIEPTVDFVAQFRFLNMLTQKMNLSMELFGVENIHHFKNTFDVIFSMGILYHHRSPLQQLFDMRMALKSGGQLVLETLGLPGEHFEILTPPSTYAGMNNIWLLPTLPALLNWLKKSKFDQIKVINTKWERDQEQRVTPYSSDVSYKDFLDPEDITKTCEGHPAPDRWLIVATKK